MIYAELEQPNGKPTKQTVLVLGHAEVRLLVDTVTAAAAANKRSSKLKALAKALGEVPGYS